MPDGVTVTSDTVTVNSVTYYASPVTLKATDSNAVIKSTNYTNSDDGTVSVTPTADTNISSNDIAFYYAVSIPNCATVDGGDKYIVNNTTYYQNGSNLTLTAKTSYNLSQTSLTVTKAETITASFDTTNHYVLADDTSTLATADNVGDYPDLMQVYELKLRDDVIVTSDTCINVDLTKYYAGSVTLTGASYTATATVDEDNTDFTNAVEFSNGGKGVVVSGILTSDFSKNRDVYSITSSQGNSTLTGNNNNNTVFIAGGGENILTGGQGNDTYKFGAGGGIVTDFGIGATKSGDGSTLSPAPGSDVLKVDGKVTGVYFDRVASNKYDATFTAVVAYDNTGDSTADQVVVLKDIIKKPTKYGSKPTYQTNDVAAATFKIWDTSGTKQAVLSATKLKKLFHDDDQLTDELKTQIASLGTLNGLGELNLPAVDPLIQSAQTTYGGDDGTK